MTEQFRLARVQLVNWGTFDGYYDIPVGERGFLITGASGSGKSTLIDAFSAVLVPPGKLRFNAAAQQETGRDKGRSRVSYIRGAWRRSEDPATGEIRSQYLRSGATASIVALTYRAGKEAFTLAAIYRLNAGQQQEAQVKTLYGIFPSEVDVDGFVPLLQNSLDKRKLEAKYKTAGVTFTDQYSVFANRFRSKLGIGSEEAQMLLHRTQSAKSLSSMDELFRNYMLDVPDTFQVAEDAVATHEDLRQAYERLEDVHQQIETLAPLPGLNTKLKDAQVTQENNAALSAALPNVRRAIEAKQLRERMDVSSAQLAALEVQAQSLEARKEAQQEAVQRAVVQREQVAGQSLGEIERNIAREEHELVARKAKVRDLAALVQMDGALDTERFAELKAQAAAELAAAPEQVEHLREKWFQARSERERLAGAEASVETELASLGNRTSNLDRRYVEKRAQLCADTGLTVRELPYVGELIDVLPEQAEWEPVIQRLLGGFAATLLVPAEREREVSSWVNGRHLGMRLEYRTVPEGVDMPRGPKNPLSLFHKVRVVEHPMRPWLMRMLATTFDYALVRTVDELERQDKRAATIDGLERNPVDRTGSARYVKNDRQRLGERRNYRLGSSNHAKVEALRAELAEAKRATTAAGNRLTEVERKQKALASDVEKARAIDAMEWVSVDVISVEEQLASLRAELDRLTSSPEAKELERAWREAVDTLKATEQELRSVHDELAVATRALQDDQARLKRIDSEHVEVDPALAEQLDAMLAATTRRLTPENLSDSAFKVTAQLDAQAKQAAKTITESSNAIVNILSNYKSQWSAESAELQAAAEFAGEAIARLEMLRSDRLPEFRGRFLDLLNGQSVMHLNTIYKELQRAKGDIETNLGPINASLRRSPYTEGRYLQIEVRDNRDRVVRDFLQDLREATAGSLSEADEKTAIERYHRLAKIMDRLGSSERADRSWRNVVLDTRRHVKFVGNEVDAEGTVHNTHVDSASLSGGQAQKLVFFCLAAALRYRLAGVDADVPRYATVVLDEAFDRADPVFTRTAMDVFESFGFHMVLATPMKLIKTLSPYVDGTIVVHYTEDPVARSTFELIETYAPA